MKRKALFYLLPLLLAGCVDDVETMVPVGTRAESTESVVETFFDDYDYWLANND